MQGPLTPFDILPQKEQYEIVKYMMEVWCRNVNIKSSTSGILYSERISYTTFVAIYKCTICDKFHGYPRNQYDTICKNDNYYFEIIKIKIPSLLNLCGKCRIRYGFEKLELVSINKFLQLRAIKWLTFYSGLFDTLSPLSSLIPDIVWKIIYLLNSMRWQSPID